MAYIESYLFDQLFNIEYPVHRESVAGEMVILSKARWVMARAIRQA